MRRLASCRRFGKVKGRCLVFTILLAVLLFKPQIVKALPLQLIQTIPLPHVEGRIDHLSIDIRGQRLFIAALGNNTVEVVDLKKGERVQSLTGFHEPQGVLSIPELNKVFVTDGGDGMIQVFNATTFEVLKSLPSYEDADNLRYDPLSRLVYVGYGRGGIAVLDGENLSPQGYIGLKAHPEAFALERSGPRIFVNVPSANRVAVLDKKKRSVVGVFPLEAEANFPMELDESHHRLFVGFRKPAKLAVLDAESGKQVAAFSIHEDPDDIFYDPLRHAIYVSCGEGFLDVLAQQDADHYQVIEKIQTAPGARTSLFVPEWGRLYLAVPHRGRQGAEIRVYDAHS
jgi:DNA-binding beta-propeller fold protein YncE